MRALLQRVKHATVEADDVITGSIARGLLVFLGVKKGDTQADADWLVEKIVNLRVFEDDAGKMNLSALDVKGELLIVSQPGRSTPIPAPWTPPWVRSRGPVRKTPHVLFTNTSLNVRTTTPGSRLRRAFFKLRWQ